MNWVWLHRWGSPPYFYRKAEQMAPWFGGLAAVCIVVGIFGGLVLAPADAFQGEVFRIMYVHAPAAWLSLMTYTVMAFAAAVGFIWRIKVSHAVAAACAPAGAAFAVLTLITGMIWGKPTWGAYWVWDPRIVSQLFLLFFYLGYMALRSAIDDVNRADRASAVLAMVGIVNVPIVHFSVEWWNSLHQAPSVMRMGKPAIGSWDMLWPLLLLFLGFTFYFAYIMLRRSQAEVLRRERGGDWLREVIAK